MTGIVQILCICGLFVVYLLLVLFFTCCWFCCLFVCGLFIVVGALSRGTDSISCRDIRYKGEDTSAYRYIERSSDAVNAATAASSVLSTTTETAAAGQLAGPQPRPITKQQPALIPSSDLSQPISLQQPEPTQPITLQQTGLAMGCQPQPVATYPIAMWQQPTLLQPITSQNSESSQPIMSQEQQVLTVGQPQPKTVKQPDLSRPFTTEQPVTVPLTESSRPVSMQQPTLSQPVMTKPSELSQPIMSQEPQVPTDGQPEPVTAKQPLLSQPFTTGQPVAVPQSELSRQQPSLSQPITTLPPELTYPIMSQQQQMSADGQLRPTTVIQSGTVTTEQPVGVAQRGSSHPSTMLQPTLSHPTTWQHQQHADSAVSSLPADTLYQHSAAGWYQPLAPPCLAPNTPVSVPTASHPPTSSPPVAPATASPAPYTNAPPIPQPTFIQDLMSRPPPPACPSPARALHPQVWSAMPQPVAGSSVLYPPIPVVPATSAPTPGILCRPLSPEVRAFVPTQKYAEAMNLDRWPTERVVQRVGEGGGDVPHPLTYARGKQFHSEVPPTERRAASLPPEISASSSTLSYGQNDFGPVYDIADGRGAETYGYGVYSSPYNVQYFPPQEMMWRSGRPAPELQSPAEFPSAEPVRFWSPPTGYFYTPPSEGYPVLYRVPSGGPQWDGRGIRMDYGLPMPSSSEIATPVVPFSQYPPSTVPEDDVVTQGSYFSGDQSSVSSSITSAIHRQSYADKVCSAVTFQHADGDVPHSTTERSDATPQSCEHEKYTTIAGNFSPGNSALTILIFFK